MCHRPGVPQTFIFQLSERFFKETTSPSSALHSSSCYVDGMKEYYEDKKINYYD